MTESFSTPESVEFSIAVPVGKEDERLAIALRSLIRQSVNANIALLDASGSERMRDIVNDFKSELAVRLHRPDTGQSAAIEAGWRETSGDILCWLNSDDALLPGALAKVTEIFAANPDTDVVYGHSTLRDSQGRTTGYHMAVDNISDALLETNLVSQPSCFVRRRAIEEIGGINPKLQYVMDWDLWVRLYRGGKVFNFVNIPFSSVVWETGTKTASVSPARLYEIFRLVHHHAGLWKAIKTIFGVLRHHLGTYTIFARLYQRLPSRRNIPARKSIAGLDRNGRVNGDAKIPLPNLNNIPQSCVLVRLEGAVQGLELLTVGDVAATAPDGDEIRIPLPSPVEPGQQAWLTIRPTHGGNLRFINATWCQDGEADI